MPFSETYTNLHIGRLLFGSCFAENCLVARTYHLSTGVSFRGTPGSRVRGWRHDLGVADPLLSVSCESASVPSPCLVSIPCHIEPDVRFSLIRLTDNLLLAVFKD